ncbi:hypothetical protein PQR05_29590 [Paraburkholderia sediminicola]|uniref:hypothetical protein n=1 Tax=Paraburkholderia sediminicola TaxID=458836 RepID=UPI0038B76D53
MNFTKWIITALLVIGAAIGSVVWFEHETAQARADGATAERAIWTEKERQREAAEKEAVIRRAQEAFAQQAENAAKNLQVETDHAQAIQALKNRVAALDAESASFGGLRISRSVCDAASDSALPAGPEADGTDGFTSWIAGTVALPEVTQRRLRAYAVEADELVEDFRSVKQWAEEHGFMPTAPDSPVRE